MGLCVLGVLLPYGAFLQAAQECRHDLEVLALNFGASIEQVAHRLSTLQRSGLKGIPFFFVRVDQAGTITKRHSATKLQFARYGGACPLWNVHRAFETPGRFLRQLAQTPDGAKYLCLALDVSKQAGSFHAPIRRYAIGLGVRSNMQMPLYTPMTWTQKTFMPLSLLGFHAGYVSAKTAIKGPFPR